MANKWTLKSNLKKKASLDGVKIPIPYTNDGLTVRATKYDKYAKIELGCYFGSMSYFFQHPTLDEASLNDLEKQIANELKPLVEQVGKKFNEIVISKGFVDMNEKLKKYYDFDNED